MSSDTSSIDLCTGALRSCVYIASPKPMPRSETRIPPKSRVWPFMPKNETLLRSGTIEVGLTPSVRARGGWAHADDERDMTRARPRTMRARHGRPKLAAARRSSGKRGHGRPLRVSKVHLRAISIARMRPRSRGVGRLRGADASARLVNSLTRWVQGEAAAS